MKTSSFVKKLFGKFAIGFSILSLLVIAAANGMAQAQEEFDAEWRLKGVIVKMKDGREQVGYVIGQPTQHCPTPSEDLILYTEVFRVSKAAGFERKTFVTTEAQKFFIKADQIAKIIPARRPLDGQIVDWQLMTVQSPEAIKWTTIEKPMAYFDRLDDDYPGRLISYNREIDDKELQQISQKIARRIEKFWASLQDKENSETLWEKEWADIKRGLELRRVVFLEYFMDCC